MDAHWGWRRVGGAIPLLRILSFLFKIWLLALNLFGSLLVGAVSQSHGLGLSSAWTHVSLPSSLGLG